MPTALRLVLCAFALNGCTRETPRAALREPVTALSQIAGRWEIARFGDFMPSWRTGDGWRRAYVIVGDEGLSYSVGCNQASNPAAIDATGVLHDLSGGRRMQTLQGCTAERQRRDEAFYAFFATRPKVSRGSDGRVTMDNGRIRLVLETPEAARLRQAPKLDEIVGRWVPREVQTFSGSGSTGGSFDSAPGVLTIGRHSLAWSECAEATVRIRYSPSFRFERLAGPVGDCRRGEQPGGDGAVKLMRLMRGDPAVLRESADRIVLFDEVEAIFLQSEASVLRPPPPPPPPPGAPVVSPPPPPPPPRQP